MRSLLSFLLLLVVILGIITFFLLAPTMKRLTQCVGKSDQAIQKLFEQGSATQWGNYDQCSKFKAINKELTACYDEAMKSNPLPISLATTVAGLINTKTKNFKTNSLIELHNTNCAQYPDTLITK